MPNKYFDHFRLRAQIFHNDKKMVLTPMEIVSYTVNNMLYLHESQLRFGGYLGPISCYCNVCETLICKLVYLFIVFGEYGRYIGNINHLW